MLCFWRGSNLGSLGLESDALPVEPPRHPVTSSPLIRPGAIQQKELGDWKSKCTTPWCEPTLRQKSPSRATTRRPSNTVPLCVEGWVGGWFNLMNLFMTTLVTAADHRLSLPAFCVCLSGHCKCLCLGGCEEDEINVPMALSVFKDGD